MVVHIQLEKICQCFVAGCGASRSPVLALPREAREANKINGLRNRLGKIGFIVLQRFSTEPPKWSQAHPSPQETPQGMARSREALFSYVGQPRSFEGFIRRQGASHAQSRMPNQPRNPTDFGALGASGSPRSRSPAMSVVEGKAEDMCSR